MKRFSAICVTAIFATLVLCSAASPVKSQTLEEWQRALKAKNNGEGCDSIPYSNYRDPCNRNQEIVNQMCGKDDDENTRPWNCKHLGTKALREGIRGMSEKLGNLKGDKDHANDASAKDNIQKQIDELSKELEFKKKSLETDLSDIEIKIDHGRRCLEARKEVQYAFASAKSNASSVNDGEEGKISKELREFWESKEKGHEKASDAVKEGISKCEKCKSGDL
jgi:hypothetical protein